MVVKENTKNNMQFRISSETQVGSLKKLSTENLIIWILGQSKAKGIILTIEEIIIECWLINPEKHSMRGFIQFPDSGVVTKRIYEMKGKKGLLQGTVQGGFSLTTVSKTKFLDIDALISVNKVSDAKSKHNTDRSISSIYEAPYNRLRKTPAYLKFSVGKINEIVETDYLYFYGISWHTKSSIIQNKILNTDSVVGKFSERDLILKEVHQLLNEKFKYVKDKLLNQN